MDSIYHRTKILIGEQNVEKLNRKTVCIFGIGGVGSYVLEAVVRAGIEKIIIVDKDVVDKTNINRQLIALNSTIGKDKVEVAKARIHDINSKIDVISIKENVNLNNLENIIKDKNIDYIVDCVDNFEAKIAIIDYAYKNNIKCISSMGMANKLNPLDIRVSDIYKTTMCPLAKNVRKKLKELNIKKQKVVYSIETPKKYTEEEKKMYGNTLGSISFVPSTAGLIIASEVIKDLLK